MAEFVPFCRYPQGSLENWRMEVVWCGDPSPTRASAQRQGLRSVGSDDFNIAQLDDEGRVVDVLWMDESINEERDVMDDITEQLKSWIGVA